MGLYEGQNVFSRAYRVGTGASIQRGTFVKLATDGTVTTAGNGEAVLGVALEDYSTTTSVPYVWPPRRAVSVRLLGTAFVEAGAAVQPGQAVQSDANGKAVPVTGSGQRAGIALTSGTAGDFIEVLLK